MDRRMLTMNWDALGDIDNDDRFFESFDRISSAVSIHLASSGSDDDDEVYDDSRISFVTALSSASEEFRSFAAVASSSSMLENYDVWMAEPGSIKERRMRLLQGMGLSGDKELLRITSGELKRPVSKEVESGNCQPSPLMGTSSSPSEEESKQESLPSPLTSIVLVRSRSDGDMESFSVNTKRRKEELLGSTSKQRLARTSSALSKPCGGICRLNANSIRVTPKDVARDGPSIHQSRTLSSIFSNSNFGAFFLIKNLDTGKEFIVKEFDQDGMWNRLSDLQTGKQLTMEEFEKCVGHSPVVKELMCRENVSRINDDGMGGSERKVSANSYLSKSFRYSKRRGVALLKNIKGVANSMSGLIIDKEKENHALTEQQKSSNKNSSSEWIKVRQHGKSYKELTALRLCQEIQAHQGSIWTIKFSFDGHYLASAGEDRIIHVWEVQECEVMSLRSPDEGTTTPIHSSCTSDQCLVSEGPSMPSERKKKGIFSTASKKGHSVPDYVYVPETVFSLSEKPVISLTGHLDDVLDLSWSKSQVSFSPPLSVVTTKRVELEIVCKM